MSSASAAGASATSDVEAIRTKAGASLRALLDELSARYPERETLLQQLALALVCREHVLVFGPPGTGKSELAGALLKRILRSDGKPSLFARQIVETTVQTDLIGPVDFKTLTETGRTVHHLDEGMLRAEFALLDEVFDGRDLLLRSILSVLNERELAVGPVTHKAQLASALLTTNRYLSEVLAARPDTLLAFSDRVAFSCFVPMNFASRESRDVVLRLAAEHRSPSLQASITVDELQALRDAAREVTIPTETLQALASLFDVFAGQREQRAAERKGYVPTAFLSPRTQFKSVQVLRAAVVIDRYVRGEKRPLRVTLDDLASLRFMVALGGPTPDRLSAVLAATRDPREKQQLENVRIETGAFEQALSVVVTEIRGAADAAAKSIGLADLREKSRRLDTSTAVDLVTAASNGLASVRSTEHRDELLSMIRSAAQVFARAARTGTLPQISAADRPTRLRVMAVLVRTLLQDPGSRDVARFVASAALVEAAAVINGALLGEAGSEFEVEQGTSITDLTDRVTGIERRLVELVSLGREIEELCPPSPLARPVAELGREAAVHIARSVRRRAMLLMRGSASSWRAIAEVSEQLAPLDKVLEKLAPFEGTSRTHVLAAAAGLLLRDELEAAPDDLAQVDAILAKGVPRLAALGIDPARALKLCRPELEKRLGAQTMSGTVELPTGTPSEDGYLQLVARCEAGTRRATVARIIENGRLEGSADAALLERGLAQRELNELAAQVTYLARWLEAVMAAAPPPDSFKTAEEAEQAWAEISATRFFAVSWRDQDLAVLEGRIRALSLVEGLSEQAEHLLTALASVSTTSERFGRAILDRRAQIVAA